MKLNRLPLRFFLNLAVVLCLGSFVFTPIASSAFQVGTSSAIPDTPVENFPSVNGIAISTLSAPDGSAYVGGLISSVGGITKYGGFGLDTTSNTAVARDYPDIGGEAFDAVSDGNGGWFVGGTFASVGGLPRNNLAHILADNTVDPDFDPDLNNRVYKLVFDELTATLYVGGDFTQVNTSSTPVDRAGIAAFNTDTGIVTGFDPALGNDGNPIQVQDIVLDGNSGTLFISGYFKYANISGTLVDRNGLASFDIYTGIATSFNPETQYATNNDLAFDSTNNILYVAGDFYQVNIGTTPVTRNYVAAFDATTGLVNGFDPDFDAHVYDIVLSDDGTSLFATGEFNTVNMGSTPVVRNGVAEFNTSNSIPTSFDPDIGSEFFNIGEDLALDSNANTIYVAGNFLQVNGNTAPVQRTNVAAFDLSTGIATDYDPIVGGVYVNGIDLDSSTDTLYVSGGIGAGGTRRNAIFHILADGTLDENFNPDINLWIYDMIINEQTNTLYVGGAFTSSNNSTNPTNQGKVAALDLTTGEAKSFDAGFDETQEGGITSLALDTSENVLYMGGFFGYLNNNTVQRDGIAAVDATTGVATSFNPGLNGGVTHLEIDVSNHILYASGTFTSVDENTTPVTRNHLAAFSTVTGTSTTFNPDINGSSVDGIGLSSNGDTLYVAGNFNTVNVGFSPVTRNNFAAFSTSSGVANAFDPDSSAPGFGIEIDETNNIAYISGLFQSLNNGTTPVSRSSLAAVSLDDGTATSFNPNVVGYINRFTIDPTNNRLYASGYFFTDSSQESYLGALAVLGVAFIPPATTTTSGATTTAATTTTSPVTTTTVNPPATTTTTTIPNTTTTRPSTTTTIPSIPSPTTTTRPTGAAEALVKALLNNRSNSDGKATSKVKSATAVKDAKTGNSSIFNPVNISIFIFLLIFAACVIYYEMRQKAKKKRESFVAPVGGDWLRRHGE